MGSTFQERLKEGMNSCGFRQADLAERTGLSKSRISHYMSGRYEAKQEALYLIAKALNVNEAWLMGHDVPKERSIAQRENDISIETQTLRLVQMHFGPKSADLLSLYSSLNEDGKQKVFELIQDLSELPRYRKDEEQ